MTDVPGIASSLVVGDDVFPTAWFSHKVDGLDSLCATKKTLSALGKIMLMVKMVSCVDTCCVFGEFSDDLMRCFNDIVVQRGRKYMTNRTISSNEVG